MKFLDQPIDRARSGAARWSDLDRVLAAIGVDRPPTKLEAVAAVGMPWGDRLVGMLFARGVLVEHYLGPRVVPVRRRITTG